MAELQVNREIVRYRRAPGCIASEIDGDIVFFHPTAGKYFASSSVGRALWSLMATPQSIDQLIAQLLDRYDVDEDTCRRDVARFLDQLQQNELIESVESK